MDCTVENCLINVVVVAVNYSSGSNHKRNAQFYELTLIIPSQNVIIAGFVIEALIKVVIVLQTGGILTCLMRVNLTNPSPPTLLLIMRYILPVFIAFGQCLYLQRSCK